MLREALCERSDPERRRLDAWYSSSQSSKRCSAASSVRPLCCAKNATKLGGGKSGVGERFMAIAGGLGGRCTNEPARFLLSSDRAKLVASARFFCRPGFYASNAGVRQRTHGKSAHHVSAAAPQRLTFCQALGGEVDHSRIACSPGRSTCTLSSTEVTQLMGMKWCSPLASLLSLIAFWPSM